MFTGNDQAAAGQGQRLRDELSELASSEDEYVIIRSDPHLLLNFKSMLVKDGLQRFILRGALALG